LFFSPPSLEGEAPSARKYFSFRKERNRPSEGKTLSSEGQKTSVRTKKNFCAHKNKFPSARKYFFFRKEIFFLAEGNFEPSARKPNELWEKRLERR